MLDAKYVGHGHLRRSALRAARKACLDAGCRVSVNGEDETAKECSDVSDTESDEDCSLPLSRFKFGDFLSGSATSIGQIQSWVSSHPDVLDRNSAPDLNDSSDGLDATSLALASTDSVLAKESAAWTIPFDAASIDAASIALVTPRWPLLVDPHGMGLKVLEQVDSLAGGEDSRGMVTMSATRVSAEVIQSAAARGQILVAINVEEGIHADLALLLCTTRRHGSSGTTLALSHALAEGTSIDFLPLCISSKFRLVLVSRHPPGHGPCGLRVPRHRAGILLEEIMDTASVFQVVRFGGPDSSERNLSHEEIAFIERRIAHAVPSRQQEDHAVARAREQITSCASNLGAAHESILRALTRRSSDVELDVEGLELSDLSRDTELINGLVEKLYVFKAACETARLPKKGDKPSAGSRTSLSEQRTTLIKCSNLWNDHLSRLHVGMRMLTRLVDAMDSCGEVRCVNAIYICRDYPARTHILSASAVPCSLRPGLIGCRKGFVR